MEESTDIGKGGLQAVFGRRKLRIVGVQHVQNFLRPVGGEGPEIDFFFGAVDLNGSAAGPPAGVNEGLRLGNDDLRVAAFLTDGV